MSVIIPFSDACERNKDVILEVISPYLADAGTVLEIGSGTGQHAIYFARHCAHLKWQTSDQPQYLAGLSAQLENAQVSNALAPIELNVNQRQWLSEPARYDVIYTANTFHIMRWQDVCGFFEGLRQVINPHSLLVVYGPFRYDGKYTSASNRAFDQNLQGRGFGSALRDFEAINDLASRQGFALLEDRSMPANNQCLVWRHQS